MVRTIRHDGHCPNEELAVGWALHALEPDEESLARDHVPDCVICQETVRSTEQLGALLGGSVPQEDPPEELRDRLMARVEQTPQQPVEVLPFTFETPAATKPIDLASRRPRRALLLAAAAVVLVLAGVAGALGVQLNKVDRERQAQAAVLSVITDPSMHRAVLTGGNGQQVAVLLSSDKGAAVVPSGLQPNDPANQTYVIWGTSADKPVALSKFDVTASGAGPETVDWSAAAAAHHGFAISLEPGRNLPARPTMVVATGQVTS